MGKLSRIINETEMQEIRAEFERLQGKCYLDNAGAALYPKCLLQSINQDLMNNIYLNPHTDKFTSDCVDQVRFKILKHFNTKPDEYTVIFTSGSTASLKLVAESFQFNKSVQPSRAKKGLFSYAVDNHTSVLGMREVAKEKRATVIAIPHKDFLHLPFKNSTEGLNENALFVFPAQNNFNGFKYPLGRISDIKHGCVNDYTFKQIEKAYKNWFVMLDAASYVSTDRLDLSVYKPDFVCISFYKIFGFPTGLGALIVNNDSAKVLSDKCYFGGGAVDVVISTEDFHAKRKNLRERFEDGTISFLSILSLNHCFTTLNNLIPKVIKNDTMKTISHHTFYLAKDLYDKLKSLKHSNGLAACRLYADSDYTDPNEQGGIVTFNLLRSDGTYIGYAEFQHMANLFNISLRTGCFCNSGTCQRHLKLSVADIKAGYKAGHVCGDEMDLYKGNPTGCIRASFGYYNTFSDVDNLMMMICKCFVQNDPIKTDRSQMNIVNEIIENNTYEEIDLNGKLIWLESEKEFSNGDYSSGILDEIAIYPIKSCGAYKPGKKWKIGVKGFDYDREWMIIQDNGTCLTQKQCTRMCMIRPDFDFDKELLILNFPGMLPISTPIQINKFHRGFQAKVCQSKVCKDFIQGYDCGEEISDWISEALEISFLKLIRQCDNDQRTSKNNSPSVITENDNHKSLSLSNQAQYLLVNKSTVRWLANEIPNEDFDKDLTGLVDRFRANLIVDTGVELVEREWQQIVIGRHVFKVEGPCTRCQMVCINQYSGEKTVEPLRTISRLFGGKMRFGIYLTYVGTIDNTNDPVIYVNSNLSDTLDGAY